MRTLYFKAEIEIYNGNPYVLVSKRRATALKSGWKKPMTVLVQIDGKPDTPWRINMMPIGDGSFYLYLHGDVRKASRTKVGDAVDVKVFFDAEYKNGPMHPMPSWFRVPLSKNPSAKRTWGALIPSRKKEILRYFSWLKSEAREKNVKKRSTFSPAVRAASWRGCGRTKNNKEKYHRRKNSVRPSEGAAEGGCGGNSARRAQRVPFGYFQTDTAKFYIQRN